MEKCGNVNEVLDNFALAVIEAQETDGINAKQKIIQDAVMAVREQLPDSLWEEAQQQMDEYLAFDATVHAAAAHWRDIFNDDFDAELAEANRSKLGEEESDSSKVAYQAQARADFLKRDFKDFRTLAARPLLYFRREAKQKLLEAFLADRVNGKLMSPSELPRSVRQFKQRLLDDIITYLKSLGYRDDQLGKTLMFDKGAYQGIFDEGSTLKEIISRHLTLGNSFDAQFLNDSYSAYRKQSANWEASKKFLDAYNAKVLLEHFDDLTSILLNKIVVPISTKAGSVSNTKYELKITKATRMWGDGFGDEVSNVADIISDVTQLLIGTSRKYNWRGEAMPDQYLTFADFSYIITKVKDLISNPEAKKIVFDHKFFGEVGNETALSSTSQRTLQTIKQIKEEQGDKSPVSFDEVLAFISDNPQRHLHTVFDILCKTNVVNKLTNINENDKNLIWSVGKEIFGTWNEVDDAGHPKPSRSLFDLHHNSNEDKIFEIITQMADSVFAEKFMQFYADQEGTLKMRVLQDYEVSRVRNNLLYRMKQTHGLIDTTRYNKYLQQYGITIDYRKPSNISRNHSSSYWTIANPDYDANVQGSLVRIPVKAQFIKTVTIPVANNALKIEVTPSGIKSFTPGENLFTKNLEAVWKDKSFRNFIKDTIGIDFDTDVELASAYEQGFKQINSKGEAKINYNRLVYDISRLCGAVVFNQAFNNVVVPTILNNSTRERTKPNVQTLIDLQYTSNARPKLNSETGAVEMLANNVKDAYLAKLGLAQATVHGLLTAATVKTGENTSLANQNLSCLRATFPYQLFTQNRNKWSATRNLTFVRNENGLYQGMVHNREIKTDAVTKTITKLSAKESFKLNFLAFTGAFIPSADGTTANRSGETYIDPTVNSDKPNIDFLRVQLNAISKYQNKKYLEMTPEELEQELRNEFSTMYDTIIKNVNEENTKIANLFNIDISKVSTQPVLRYRELLTAIENGICNNTTWLSLAQSNSTLKEEIETLQRTGTSESEIIPKIIERAEKKQDETYEEKKERERYEKLRDTLYKIKKSRISSQLRAKVTQYNRSHRRKPIETCEQIHYIFNKKGQMVPNDTLIALWGRFNGNDELNARLGITALYPKGHESASTAEGYFRHEKDLRLAEELLRDDFEVFLYGGKANKTQEELTFLRDNYPQWITKSGKMMSARRFIPDKYCIGDSFTDTRDGTVATITNISVDSNKVRSYEVTYKKTTGESTVRMVKEGTLDETLTRSYVNFLKTTERPGVYEAIEDRETFNKYKNDPNLRDSIEIHPMLRKLNRIYFLVAHQYVCSVGGSHYVYKGGGADVLEEEANRWLASNKRNVCYGSTIHKYQNKTLKGVPKWYQIAPIEDIKSDVYSIMGDLNNHKPIDGGMFVHPCFPYLENNSLGGEAAGLDKKQFGTYYYEKYAAGGIIKTAGFAETNQRMLRSEAYRALCKNMMNRTWLKEFTDANAMDIEEVLDITRDYDGNMINWVTDPNGQGTYYARETADGKFKRFKLAGIEAIYTNNAGEERTFKGKVPPGWSPTNRYKIYEYPVNESGEIDVNDPAIAAQLHNKEELHPIQRTFGANENGEFLINNNWDFFTNVFGGYYSMSINSSGKLKYSENSILQMVEAMNRIGYKRDTAHNDERFGSQKYTVENVEKIEDQDDVWQPLKYSDICYAPNIGALKSTQMNVNPSEAMYQETFLNTMNIVMAQLGIQLDKEHHADDAEVSMPTQIIQACANKGYTIEHSDKLYKALSSLTELAIEDCMESIQEMMPGHENKGTLLAKVATIIVDKLIQSKDDNVALEAALSELLKLRNEGKELHPEDVVGKVAWSDAKFYNKVYSDLASHLTNSAIKMKFPGTLAVICPTERMEQMYGDRRLNQFADPNTGFTEKVAMAHYQDQVRNGDFPKQLIYDEFRDKDRSTIKDKLSLASNLVTQHHYWVEFTYSDGSSVVDEKGQIYKESYTLNTPMDYYKLKELLAYGRKAGTLKINGKDIEHQGLKVSKVYENVTKGRELGAFNIRFTASGQQFNIFDLASIQQLFAYNEYPHTVEQAGKLLMDNIFVGSQYAYAQDLILRLIKKKYPKVQQSIDYYIDNYGNADLLTMVNNMPPELQNDAVEAIFKVCKVLTYKHMQDDLFKLSPDYKGSRRVILNSKPWDTHIEYYNVDPGSIKSQAYELIMPKVYQTRFGLQEQDNVQEILADKDFFSKRAVERVRTQKVGEHQFHYELKNFNGKHVYIWDTRLGTPDPAIFKDKQAYIYKNAKGNYERRNLDGEFMHKIASEKDKIMQVGNLGYEVICTDNPAFYFENMEYNLADFSNATIKEENLLQLENELKDTQSRKAKKFLRVLIDKTGKPRNFKFLQARNRAISQLSLRANAREPNELRYLREEFIQEGRELHASFDKSLDIIAGRIPAQSQQSFMPQRVVAFDNNNINTAYVSTFQLFLQGSNK